MECEGLESADFLVSRVLVTGVLRCEGEKK